MIEEQTVKAHPNSFVHASPQGKTPSVNVLFDLIDGPNQGDQITAYLYLSDKTEQRTCESLLHCGWTGKDFKNLPGFGTKDVYLVIEHDTYEGKTSAKVKWVNSGTRTAGVKDEDRMQDREIKGFAQRMEMLAKGALEGTPKPAEAAPRRAPKNANRAAPIPPPENDFGGYNNEDDIPF